MVKDGVIGETTRTGGTTHVDDHQALEIISMAKEGVNHVDVEDTEAEDEAEENTPLYDRSPEPSSHSYRNVRSRILLI